MKQLIYIHGGMCYPDNDVFCKSLETWEYDPFEEKKRRANRLKDQLASDYQTIKPDMPNKQNASYKARKIRFEKILPYLNDDGVVLVGHSLGWIFLLKYLSENDFPKHIDQLHLVAAVVDETDMPDEEKYLGDFLFDVEKMKNIQDQVEKVFVYHSTDDPVVPYSHAERLLSYLPAEKLISFTDRGHFSQSEFPELLENILHG